MKTLKLILVNKTTQDPTLIVPYTTGRKTELFAATERPSMSNTAKKFSNLLKTPVQESKLLDIDSQILSLDHLKELTIFDNTNAEVLVIIANSMALALIHAKLTEKGMFFPMFGIRTGEILLVDFESQKLEFIYKLKHVVSF